MSITVNGATNTITAASGLAIAGNTAVTGTLSCTTQLSAQGVKSLTNGNTYFQDLAGRNYLLVGGSTASTVDTLFAVAGNTTVAAFSATGLAVTGTLSATGVTSSTATGEAYKLTAAASGTNGAAQYLAWYRNDGTTRKMYIGFGGADSVTTNFVNDLGTIVLAAQGGATTVSSTGLAVTGTLSASGTITGTSATVGGAVGTSFQHQIVNTHIAVGDWAGTTYRWIAGDATTTQAYIGAVVTSSASNGLSDLVFAVKDAAGSSAVTEYMRIAGGGVVSIASTTDATSTTAASLKTAGGLGVAKKAYIGTDLSVGANATFGAAASGISVITGYAGAGGLLVGTLIGSQGAGNLTLAGNLADGTTATVSMAYSNGGAWYSGVKLSPTTGGGANRGTLALMADGGSITSGANIVMASGKGIDFSATTDGSGTTTSEVLSDYEEGTWTPVVAFGGASVGITYTQQVGLYIKVGRVVTVQINVVMSSKGSSVGDATITGLPFTSVGYRSTGSIAPQLLSFTDIPYALIEASSTLMYLRETSNAGVVDDLTDVEFTNSTVMTISATYPV
jgi:hypothetical protein